MNTLNFQVISSVCEWLEQGDCVYFVTVLNTWGASPRPKGSLFAFNVDKVKQVGSLSGGCIEEDLVQYLGQMSLALKHETSNSPSNSHSKSCLPFLKRYGEKSEDKDRYLLPCGGTLELLIEPILDSQHFDHYRVIKESLASHKPIARIINFQSEIVSYTLDVAQTSKSAQDTLIFNYVQAELYHRLDPAFELLIVGAGDVTIYVNAFAKSLDFNVSICEPRKQYAQRLTSLESDAALYYCLPDDLIKKQFSQSNSAIICLAHDPKVDDMALIEALSSSEAFYIGAMGSLKTTENRIVRLKSLGLHEQQLERLHAPIGINIHSKTPEEIAISILAELIAARHEFTVQSIG